MPRLLVLALALLAAACGSTSDLASSPRTASKAAAVTQDPRAELFAADAAHTAAIAQLGPIDGVLRPMSGNAVYLTPGFDVLRGRHDIHEALAAEYPDPQHTTIARTLLGGDVSADGNFGFTFGWLQRTMPDGLLPYGAYVAVWQREDGEGFRVTAYFSRPSVRRVPVAPGFPLLSSGPGAGGVPHADSMAALRRSVLAADTAFAELSVAQGSDVAFPAYASPDFLLIFGGNFVPLVGAQAIADAYAGPTPGETLDWAPVYVGAAASGDLAYTVGDAVDTVTAADGSVSRAYSKYLTLWARNADGAWRFIADGGSPSPAPAP
jgi:ketosteroid isomerase-like protein